MKRLKEADVPQLRTGDWVLMKYQTLMYVSKLERITVINSAFFGNVTRTYTFRVFHNNWDLSHTSYDDEAPFIMCNAGYTIPEREICSIRGIAFFKFGKETVQHHPA